MNRSDELKSKSLSIQNRRYLGNKYKLIDFIKKTIKENCPGISSFFDAFAGTGVVAYSLMENYKVIVNDSLYSNYVVYKAFMSNDSYDEFKISNEIDYMNSINPDILSSNYVSDNFGDKFFSIRSAKKIGYLREYIQNLYETRKIAEREYYILLTVLLYALDRIANTCGHYDSYRIVNNLDDDLILFPLDLSKKPKNAVLYNRDINELVLSGELGKVDCVYLDPPYNSRNYCDTYHVIENIALWKKPEVFGKARKMDRTMLKSKYSSAHSAKKAFSELVDHLNCKYIILSYNNTQRKCNVRSNACMSDEDILEVLSRKGRVKVYSKKYRAFTTGKSLNDLNEERLFVCVVKEDVNPQKLIKAPLNYTGGKTKLLPQLLPLFPKEINTFVDLFCGAGNVGINVSANNHIYVDANQDLIKLLEMFSQLSSDELLVSINEIIRKYGLSESSTYGYEKYNTTSMVGLASYNKPLFVKLRDDFNNAQREDKNYYIMLYVLIVFAFNNQLRFNSNHQFNLPVGKRDFNKNIKANLLSFSEAMKRQEIRFLCMDFRSFQFTSLSSSDFVYCDPPYLLATATYNENSGWTETDEKDLLRFLDTLNERHIKFALSNVLEHKGKVNSILSDWSKNYNTHKLISNYKNSSYQSKNRDETTVEVLITNY